MEKQYTAAEVDAILRYQAAVPGAPTGVPAHGPGGLFSTPGLQPGVVNAMVLPVSGLRAELPMFPSNEMNPIRAILTGQTASVGTEPTTACADATTPGNLKICQWWIPFGRTVKDSSVIQVDAIGQINNRGEMRDQRLIGRIQPTTPRPLAMTPRQIFMNQATKKIYELMIALHRDYRRDLFIGDPTNTPGTGYIQHYGLEFLINTGHQDISGQLCPAADPIIYDFASANIAGNEAAVVTRIIEMVADRRYLAQQLGLDPVTFALVGRYSLFRKLTEIWPCTYYSSRCVMATGAVNNLSADEITKLRDNMRQGMYLLVDGEPVRFIVDDSAPETVPVAGTYESDLYLIPLTSPAFVDTNGYITYMEFFDYSDPNSVAGMLRGGDLAFLGQDNYSVLDGGRYLMHVKPPTNWCAQVGLLTRERLIIEAPFLAARFLNLRYTPQIHERSPFPGDSTFVNGGVTTVAAPTFLPPVDV